MRSKRSSGRAPSSPYGLYNFLLDLLLILATAGLWIIWILIREMRRR